MSLATFIRSGRLYGRVAYASLRAGTRTIYRKPADGSGAEEMLVSDAGGGSVDPPQ
jgi:hypothetical protein